jgi:CoA-transferase family III
VGISISDIVAGLYLYAGIAKALYDRKRTEKGTQVDIAMFDATLALLEHPFMAYAATGKAPGRIGNRHASMTPSTSSMQKTILSFCAVATTTCSTCCVRQSVKSRWYRIRDPSPTCCAPITLQRLEQISLKCL